MLWVGYLLSGKGNSILLVQALQLDRSLQPAVPRLVGLCHQLLLLQLLQLLPC